MEPPTRLHSTVLNHKSQKFHLLFLNLVLPNRNGVLISKIALRGSQAGIYLFHVSGWNEPLSVIYFHFPPILVGTIQESEYISLLHRNLSRRFLLIIIQSNNAFLAQIVNNRTFLLLQNRMRKVIVVSLRHETQFVN